MVLMSRHARRAHRVEFSHPCCFSHDPRHHRNNNDEHIHNTNAAPPPLLPPLLLYDDDNSSTFFAPAWLHIGCKG